MSDKSCMNCKHRDVKADWPPCDDCHNPADLTDLPDWEQKEVEDG